MSRTEPRPGLRFRTLAGIAVCGLAVLACGGTKASPAGPTTVAVTLQEWSIVPATTTLDAGSVTFEVTNSGPDDAHELVVIKTDLGTLDLPTGADGKVDEAGAGMEFLGEVEEIAVGASDSGTFELTAGRYLLICNIVDAEGDAHYGKGMTTAITVK